MKQIYIVLVLGVVGCSTIKITESPSVFVPTEQSSDEVAFTKEAKEVSVDMSEKEEKQCNVSISLEHFTPYCGGAAPDQDMLSRRTTKQSNTIFFLIDLSSKEKREVRTDDAGVLCLDLPTGRYAIQEAFKNYSFAEFMQNVKVPQGMYYQSMDEACYKQWWSSYLGEFEVVSKETPIQLNWGTSDGCFTGNNPCIIYTGPYPP